MVAEGEATMPDKSLTDYFGDMPDPRVQGRCDHLLVDIIMIAICAVLAGAEGWEEIEEFGMTKENWLKAFLALPNGIPSHDTFRRVFSLLDAAAFQERFAAWVEVGLGRGAAQTIAIDGKSLRGSHAPGKAMLHLVSAWACENGLVLGQKKVDGHSNEITAIPELLTSLYLSGCIVTIDALGTQKEIARQIIEAKADYILALKGNQGQLYEDVIEWFDWVESQSLQEMPVDTYQQSNKGHGRIETRRCWVIEDKQAFEHIRHHGGWTGLRSIIKLQRERRIGDDRQQQTAYYISSLPADAKRIAQAIRAHWAIETSFHWTLDVTFDEDRARMRTGDSAENFAVLRHIALNLIKRHPAKLSVKRKRFKAALDDQFLLELLLSQF
jgi:predicted transposase YbfD/YdcC